MEVGKDQLASLVSNMDAIQNAIGECGCASSPCSGISRCVQGPRLRVFIDDVRKGVPP